MRAVSIFLLLVLHSVLLHGTEATPSDFPLSQRWAWFSSSKEPTSRSPPKSKKKWTSMFKVDPSKILSTLVKRGGLLIPKSLEKEIDALKKVLRVEQAELNLYEKQLILYNFTIALKGKKNAVRVGRVFVHWDSYTKPCIDIEVDEVDVLVEFTNLMLTHNNWNELKEHGFPPTLAVSEAITTPSLKKETETSSYIRFSSIDLSGNATIQVASRPLRKDIGVVTLDMDVTDRINKKIRELSKSNKASTGRAGCTTTELTDLLQSYFSQQIRKYLSKSLKDLASDPGSAARGVDRILTKTSDTILGYATDATRKSGDDIQGAIAARLSRWGFSADQIATLKERSRDATNNVNTESLAEKLRNALMPKDAKQNGQGD